MTVSNALTDARRMVQVEPRSRRRCWCGCKQRATHKGLANGVVMTTGCELMIRRWVRDPREAIMAVRRRSAVDKLNS